MSHEVVYWTSRGATEINTIKNCLDTVCAFLTVGEIMEIDPQLTTEAVGFIVAELAVLGILTETQKTAGSWLLTTTSKKQNLFSPLPV